MATVTYSTKTISFKYIEITRPAINTECTETVWEKISQGAAIDPIAWETYLLGTANATEPRVELLHPDINTSLATAMSTVSGLRNFLNAIQDMADSENTHYGEFPSGESFQRLGVLEVQKLIGCMVHGYQHPLLAHWERIKKKRRFGHKTPDTLRMDVLISLRAIGRILQTIPDPRNSYMYFTDVDARTIVANSVSNNVPTFENLSANQLETAPRDLQSRLVIEIEGNYTFERERKPSFTKIEKEAKEIVKKKIFDSKQELIEGCRLAGITGDERLNYYRELAIFKAFQSVPPSLGVVKMITSKT